MKKNKSFISRFFSHNITLLVFAFILAFAAWFYITANTQTTKTISNIPITIELSEELQNEGYTVFPDGDQKGTVQVSGNRSTLGSLTSSDIILTADTGSVTGSGDYTFTLIASKKSINSNYKIDSIYSPSSRSVTAYVDKEKQQKFTIDNQIKVSLNDKSHYANVEISPSDVMLSGPETFVSQIAGVAVVDDIPKFDSDTKTVTEELVFMDETGSEINFAQIKTDPKTVDVTITVLPVKTVDLKVDVVNAPSDYPTPEITPSSVKVAGTEENLNQIKDDKITVGSLDFSKLKNASDTKQEFEIKVPDGCQVISGKTTVSVSLDLSTYVYKKLTGEITAKQDSDTYTAQLESNTVDLDIYGNQDQITDLTSDDISITLDFGDKLDNLKSGESISLSVPLKIDFDSDYTDCWVYGSYTTKVIVTKK